MINLPSKWAIADVETSGFRSSEDRVLSLAIVTLDENLNVEETFYTLLNPGVDPGPVEVHGLTSEMLSGAPEFSDIFNRISNLLRGRVMVAHNASFDHAFLSAEAERIGQVLEVSDVLCSLRASKHVGPKLENYKLSSLASFYGVRQEAAHNALDDTLVLVEIFKHLHDAALSSNSRFYALGEKTPRVYSPKPKKEKCLFVNPGRFENELIEGMRVVFTGSDHDREALENSLGKMGIDVCTSVSSKTSLLVSDGFQGTKTIKALAVNCPTISYSEFKKALAQGIKPGLRAS